MLERRSSDVVTLAVTPVVDLDVLGVLTELGVESIHVNGDEISAKCPGHERNVGRPDRHASWGINAITGLHYCFSCGYRGNVSTLYMDITGDKPPADLQERALLSALTAAVKEAPKSYSIVDSGSDEVDEFEWGYWVPLGPKVLRRRYLSRFAAEAYGVAFDTYRGGVVTPVFSERGDMVGGQWRLLSGPITLPTDFKKSDHLFGLGVAKSFDTVALVESPLDAVRMYSVGIPAVSSLGANVSDQQVYLLNRYWKMVVIATDNDSPGIRAGISVSSRLRRMGCPTMWFDYTGLLDADGSPAKDPGDVADDDALVRSWGNSLRVGDLSG